MKRIWILDPFHAGSHAQWAKGLDESLNQEGFACTLHTMPGRHWKWRMHGAAAWFAHSLFLNDAPEVIVTTDMCDVAQLKGLMPPSWSNVKVVTYFHENQLTFPWSPEDIDPKTGRDLSYGYINLSTCLASDAIWFNSSHHKEAFLSAAENHLSRMPKPTLGHWRACVEPKASVLPLGLHLPPMSGDETNGKTSDEPTILWNQRWAWDKGTDRFGRFVRQLMEEELKANFIIMGQSFQRVPDGWLELKDLMGSRCLHWGYAESKEAYWHLLRQADLTLVDPRQEYFGLAVVEAMSAGVVPWVPNQHAYPETMPPQHEFLGHDDWLDAFKEQRWNRWPVSVADYKAHARRYDWSSAKGWYVQALNELMTT